MGLENALFIDNIFWLNATITVRDLLQIQWRIYYQKRSL